MFYYVVAHILGYRSQYVNLLRLLNLCEENPVRKTLLLPTPHLGLDQLPVGQRRPKGCQPATTPRLGPNQFSVGRRCSKGCQPTTTSRATSSNKLVREVPDASQPRKDPTWSKTVILHRTISKKQKTVIGREEAAGNTAASS